MKRHSGANGTASLVSLVVDEGAFGAIVHDGGMRALEFEDELERKGRRRDDAEARPEGRRKVGAGVQKVGTVDDGNMLEQARWCYRL